MVGCFVSIACAYRATHEGWSDKIFRNDACSAHAYRAIQMNLLRRQKALIKIVKSDNDRWKQELLSGHEGRRKLDVSTFLYACSSYIMWITSDPSMLHCYSFPVQRSRTSARISRATLK